MSTTVPQTNELHHSGESISPKYNLSFLDSEFRNTKALSPYTHLAILSFDFDEYEELGDKYLLAFKEKFMIKDHAYEVYLRLCFDGIITPNYYGGLPERSIKLYRVDYRFLYEAKQRGVTHLIHKTSKEKIAIDDAMQQIREDLKRNMKLSFDQTGYTLSEKGKSEYEHRVKIGGFKDYEYGRVDIAAKVSIASTLEN